MRKNFRAISLILAVLMMSSAFAGCSLFGGGKAPEKAIVDHVYDYETVELATVGTNDSEENIEYIRDLFIYEDYYVYATEHYDKDYRMDKYTVNYGKFDKSEKKSFEINTLPENEDSYRGINSISMSDDRFYAVVYESVALDIENYVYEQKNYVEEYDLDGNFLGIIDLKKTLGFEDAEYFSINSLNVAGDELFVRVYGDEGAENVIYRCEKDGTIIESFEIMEEDKDGYVNYVKFINDSKLAMAVETYTSNDYNLEMHIVDIITGERKVYDLGKNYSVAYSSFFGKGGEVYYADDRNIYKYDLESGTETQLMNFINSDYIYGGGDYVAVSDDEFVCLYNEYDGGQTTLSYTTFKRVPDEEITPKYLITVASAGNSYAFTEQIVNFNRASDEYRIKYLDYAEYNTDEDYTLGAKKLESDIIAGYIPDIIITDESFSAAKYVNKGFFADLLTFMEGDEKFNKEAFLPNIIEGASVDGKLYEMPVGFYVNVYVGIADRIFEFDRLTIREFYETAMALPEGTTFFRNGDINREIYLRNMFFMNYSSFIDQATGRCSLNSDDFKALLEFASTLPEKTRWDDENFDFENFDHNAYNNMFRDGKAIAQSATLVSFRDALNYSYNFGENETKFIGMPSPDRNGFSFNTTGIKMIISSESLFPNEAWSFVKLFFEEDYQQRSGWGFPVTKAGLESAKQKVLDEIVYAEQEEENEEDFIIDGIGGYYRDRRLTAEDVEAVYEIVTSVNKQYVFDEAVFDIVMEEASEYFAGKKSLDAVATQIESRVNIKINESR